MRKVRHKTLGRQLTRYGPQRLKGIMIELTDAPHEPKLETEEELRKRKREEFFNNNVARLKAFHDANPKMPPPIRWDESTQEYKWIAYNREMKRSGIILTDSPVKIIKP